MDAFALVLRALAHRNLGRIEHEPRLHAKRLLGEHAHDDARSAAALAGPPAAPGPELAALLDRLLADPGHDVAYGEVKPALAAAARARLATAPEAALPALTELALRQERHVDELPLPRAALAWGPLPEGTVAGAPPALPVAPAPSAPARDAFALDVAAYDPIELALQAAEAAAREAYERADADPARTARVAERLADLAALDAERTRDGAPWGLPA